MFIIIFLTKLFYIPLVLSEDLFEIYVDSLSNSAVANGSNNNPYNNISAAFSDLKEKLNSSSNFSLSMFLKRNEFEKDSIYTYSDFFYDDLENCKTLKIGEYFDKNLINQKHDNNKVEGLSILKDSIIDLKPTLLFYVPENEIYTLDFLIFIYNNEFILENINIQINFKNEGLRVIFQIYQMSILFSNCVFSLAGFPLIGDKVFLQTINSNLTVVNCEFRGENIIKQKENFIDLTIFSCNYYEDFMVMHTDFSVHFLNNSLLGQIGKGYFKKTNFLVVEGTNIVNVYFLNNKFEDSFYIINKGCIKKLISNNEDFVLTISITMVNQLFIISNKMNLASLVSDCKFNKLRFELGQIKKLFIMNESYFNLLMFFVLEQIAEMKISDIEISSNSSVSSRLSNDQYIFMYFHNYMNIYIAKLKMFNYVLKNSILIQFQPFEQGQTLVFQNISLNKVSGKLYFLFEPNLFLSNNIVIKRKISFQNFKISFFHSGGLVFNGLVPSEIDEITFSDLDFQNLISQSDGERIFFEGFLNFQNVFAQILNFTNINFKDVNSYFGFIIKLEILNPNPSNLVINNMSFDSINSDSLSSFLSIECTSVFMNIRNLNFKTIKFSMNLISIKSLKKSNTSSENLLLSAVTFDFINQTLSSPQNSYFSINKPAFFDIDYPKITIEDLMIKNSWIRNEGIFINFTSFFNLSRFKFQDSSIEIGKLRKENEDDDDDEGLEIYFIAINGMLNASLSNIFANNIELNNQNNRNYFYLYGISETIHNLEIVYADFQNLNYDFTKNFHLLYIFENDEYQFEIIQNLILVNSTFSNLTSIFAPVMTCSKGAILIENCKFIDNFASIRAGVFQLSFTCFMKISNCIFINNKAMLGQIFAIDTMVENEMNLVLIKNNFFQLNNNWTSQYGLIHFINQETYIYNCSYNYLNQGEAHNLTWGCKRNSGVYQYSFVINKKLKINGTQDAFLIENDFKFFQQMKDIFYQYPNNKKIENISIFFDLSFQKNSLSFNSFPSNLTTTTQNFYFSSFSRYITEEKKINFKYLSFIGYFNPNVKEIRCSEGKNCIFPFLTINMNECGMGEMLSPGKRELLSCTNCREAYVIPFNAYKGKCEPCLINGNCEAGIISPKEGFWRQNTYTDKIFYCTSSNNNCLGGAQSECSSGYRGILCQACDASNGFFKSFHDECKQCGSGFDSKCLSNHNINDFEGIQEKYSKKDQISKLVNILITYLQIIVLLNFYSVNVPNELLFFAEVFVNMNSDILYSHYCLIHQGGIADQIELSIVYANFIFIMFSSLFRLLCLSIFWLLIKRKEINNQAFVMKRISEENAINNESLYTIVKENEEKIKMNYSYLSLFAWFSVEGVMMMKQIFQMYCLEMNGDYFITNDFNYKCDHDYYSIYLPILIIPFTIIYSILIPLFIYGVLIISHKKLKNRDFINKYATLYLAVKPSLYFWHFVNYLFKFAIVLIASFVLIDPVKIVALLITLIVYSGMVFFLQPYVFKLLNRLEIIYCYIFLITLTFSQTQILANLYEKLTYLNVGNRNLEWVRKAGYILVLFANFLFVFFIIIKIVILFSKRVRRWMNQCGICVKFASYLRRRSSNGNETLITNDKGK